jgi:hypothetical protein
MLVDSVFRNLSIHSCCPLDVVMDIIEQSPSLSLSLFQSITSSGL